MLIERTSKELHQFNLHNEDEREAYGKLLSNPAIKVVGKRFEEMTQSEIQGEMISKWTELHVYVEVERCRL